MLDTILQDGAIVEARRNKIDGQGPIMSPTGPIWGHWEYVKVSRCGSLVMLWEDWAEYSTHHIHDDILLAEDYYAQVRPIDIETPTLL